MWEFIQIVSEYITKELTPGDFYKDWNNMNSVYKNNDLTSKNELNEEFENLKLNPSYDTGDWINKMEGYMRELRENHNL